MVEAYYEELKVSSDGIRYPFDSFIEDTRGKNFNIPPHWHYYIELLYFMEGSARVFIGGEYCNVISGDFVLINSREVHSISSEEGTATKYIVIKFDPEVLYTTSRTVFEAKYILPFTMSQHKHQKIFRKQEIANTIILETITEIYKEYFDKKYGYELAVRNGIGTLFLWVIRNWEANGTVFEVKSIPKEVDIQKLQQLFDYLDKHYSEEISADDMAKMCSMSYSYFSRFFKKVTGKTFTDYLNYIRITEAEKLLMVTDMNITQVALNTGFTNSSYFIKQFRHYKGLSPKKFSGKVFNK